MVDLAAEEAAGGHTIARHVGKSEQELRRRLAAYPRMIAASSFVDVAEAEQAVEAALIANSGVIRAWLAAASRRGPRVDLAVHWNAPRPIGRLVVRATGGVRRASRLRVVLSVSPTAASGYIVLTAFPEP